MKLITHLPILCIFTLPITVLAESLGTHCWRQDPTLHILCFEVDMQGKYIALLGEDIIPGEARYPVRGTALFDESNDVYRIEFTQNLGGINVFENAATLDKNTLSGPWTDDGGENGTFQYLGGPDQISQ